MADVINAVVAEAQLPPRLACLLTINDLVYMFVNLETPMFLERDPIKN